MTLLTEATAAKKFEDTKFTWRLDGHTSLYLDGITYCITAQGVLRQYTSRPLGGTWKKVTGKKRIADLLARAEKARETNSELNK